MKFSQSLKSCYVKPFLTRTSCGRYSSIFTEWYRNLKTTFAIFTLTFLPSLSLGKKNDHPIAVAGPKIGDVQIVGLFATFQEYRDLVTVLSCIGVFFIREYYQFRKDRDTVAAQKLKSEVFEKQIIEMEKSQGRIEQSLKHMTELMKQQNNATDGRLRILERKL